MILILNHQVVIVILVQKLNHFELVWILLIIQVSPCMERAVLDQLADYFNSRLARYPTTLAEDETLVTVYSYQLLNINPRMLLNGF